jgi:hypothetical protein
MESDDGEDRDRAHAVDEGEIGDWIERITMGSGAPAPWGDTDVHPRIDTIPHARSAPQFSDPVPTVFTIPMSRSSSTRTFQPDGAWR